MPEVLFVRDDDGDGLCSVLASMDTDVADKIARFVDGLKTLEGNVLRSRTELSTLEAVRTKRGIPLHFAT
jgi:hypothetical protein